MAFSYLESVGIPGDIVDDIAKTIHALTLLPALNIVPSFFEKFASRDDSTNHDDALSRLREIYGRDDIMLFQEGCEWYDICIIAFDDSDYFIMWFLNKSYGITYLMEGNYDYDYDIFTVERFYHKSSFDSEPVTDSNYHAPFIHHGLNGTPFSTLATVMGEGSMRCTMSFMNDTKFQWINPEMVCAWFLRITQ